MIEYFYNKYFLLTHIHKDIIYNTNANLEAQVGI